MSFVRSIAAVLVFAMLASCGGSGGGGQAGLTRLVLQLQWTPQAQFAGYFTALDQGFFRAEGLDVVLQPGGVNIVPQQALIDGTADLAIAWVPKALVSREQGAHIVDIAQVFQRSGTLEVSWRDSGITRPQDWRGKRVGTWGFGNEFELYAAIAQAGMDPARDMTIVPQSFDMSQLLARQLDAAEAEVYNEYALVLETRNPATGALYQPSDLSVIDFNRVGTAMLQDAIWAREDWLADPAHRDLAVRFLRAAFRGWIYARDNFPQALGIVLAHNPSLARTHQAWQLNEVNKLIWPSPGGIGVMDPALWQETVNVATSQHVLQHPPDAAAYRADLAQAALASLSGDLTGANFRPQQITLTEGGR